ncbi:hypothetical protein BMETH_3000_0 [methanotrophic bacterial endosymbiont of Bathymodiolus sp.]|nr:hypothetical protein BMETH_3000_0 [methanotrophic bacterial endosymbiont of Bathymodiolus sp.]
MRVVLFLTTVLHLGLQFQKRIAYYVRLKLFYARPLKLKPTQDARETA